MKPSLEMMASEIGDECEGLLAPLSAATVKGYTRSMAMWCCLLCARENAHFLEALASESACAVRSCPCLRTNVGVANGSAAAPRFLTVVRSDTLLTMDGYVMSAGPGHLRLCMPTPASSRAKMTSASLSSRTGAGACFEELVSVWHEFEAGRCIRVRRHYNGLSCASASKCIQFAGSAPASFQNGSG